MSILQSDTPEVKAHLANYPQVSCIEKPIMRRRLYEVAVHKLLNAPEESVDVVVGGKITKEETAPVCPARKVLLVNDHRVDQMVISAMLKKSGCYVQLATTGSKAVEILEKENFDLVLMDRSEEHTSELQSRENLVCRLLPEKKTINYLHMTVKYVTTTDTSIVCLYDALPILYLRPGKFCSSMTIVMTRL